MLLGLGVPLPLADWRRPLLAGTLRPQRVLLPGNIGWLLFRSNSSGRTLDQGVYSNSGKGIIRSLQSTLLRVISHISSRSQRHTSPKPTQRNIQQGEREIISFNNLLQKLPEEPIHKPVLFERGSIGCNMHLKPDPIHAVAINFLHIQR